MRWFSVRTRAASKLLMLNPPESGLKPAADGRATTRGACSRLWVSWFMVMRLMAIRAMGMGHFMGGYFGIRTIKGRRGGIRGWGTGLDLGWGLGGTMAGFRGGVWLSRVLPDGWRWFRFEEPRSFGRGFVPAEITVRTCFLSCLVVNG